MKILKNNIYFADIFKLTSWSLISNGILVLFTPLLTRIYTPSDYGDYSIYYSFLTLLALFSSGRYEFAIALPKSDDIARSIFYLIFRISLFFSIFIFILLGFLLYLKVDLIISSNLYFVTILPISIFLSAINSAFIYLSYRGRKYNFIGVILVSQTIINILANFILHYCKFEYGLITGFLLGQVTSGILFYTLYKKQLGIYNKKLIKAVFYKYIKFPKFNLPKDILSTLSQSFLPVVLSFFFTKSFVGFFAVSNRLLRVPTILIASSVSNVFRNEAIANFHKRKSNTELLKYTLKKMVIISIPFFLFLAIFSESIFCLLLGNDWVIAGQISKAITFMIFFDFISVPFMCIYQIYGKHNVSLLLESITCLISLLVIILSYYLFNSFYNTILALSIVSSFLSLLNIFIIFRISKNKP